MNLGMPFPLAGRIGDRRAAALAATGSSSQANGYAIKNSVNTFTTVTNASADSATLPTEANCENDDIFVKNEGAGTLKVYPHSGGKINNGSTNAVYYIATGQSAHFKRTSSTGWFAVGGGPLNGSQTFSLAGSGVVHDIGTLAALGTTITDAAAITHEITVVTATDDTVGVKLPALAAVSLGQIFIVINSVTNKTLKIYSNASGELISGQAGDTAIVAAAKLSMFFLAYDSTHWYAIKGVLPY